MVHQQVAALVCRRVKDSPSLFRMKTPQIFLSRGLVLKRPSPVFCGRAQVSSCLSVLAAFVTLGGQSWDCRAGREMSRQPLSSSLMPVQVRNVFIAECTVCVCAHVCLGKFQRQRIMHLNYTPVWSYSPAQELKSCKESTEVTNTICFF